MEHPTILGLHVLVSFACLYVSVLIAHNLRSRPRQAQCLVAEQRIDQAVTGGGDSDAQNDAEWDQLRWDTLEFAQTLGDCVSWCNC